jgi:NhaA family Na+:H+ antiporter
MLKKQHGAQTLSTQTTSPPPGAWKPLIKIATWVRRPLDRFLRIEAASGILLLTAAALALVWANSPWQALYTHLWHTPLGFHLGSLSFQKPLEWYVNDVLMVVFFFLVGMEIRREIHQGELSQWRRAALPAAAALGGMAAPAIIYTCIAGDPHTRIGWGIPTATDIAFAVGILALLGKRVPPALRVLLLALAVIDDLGAIVVIALFYSTGVNFDGFAWASLGFLGIFFMQGLGIRQTLLYVLPACMVWAGIYQSGVHPTIAGVLIGLITPVHPWKGVSPSQSLIETLHPWVAFGIMPLFALANAGVTLPHTVLQPDAWHVVAGVSIGLMAGKPIGILLTCWFTLRTGLATLPIGLGVRHLVVLGVVAGIGFTMALFVGQLSFPHAPHLLAGAKIGVLTASTGAALCGLALGRLLLPTSIHPEAAQTAHEAEHSTEK